MKLSKEDFVKCINKLRDANDFCNRVNSIMREYEGVERDFMDAAGLMILNEDLVVMLLETIMDDNDKGFSDISYFIYELDYGRRYEPGMIMDGDQEVDFSTAEKLYDYLVMQHQNTK